MTLKPWYLCLIILRVTKIQRTSKIIYQIYCWKFYSGLFEHRDNISSSTVLSVTECGCLGGSTSKFNSLLAHPCDQTGYWARWSLVWLETYFVVPSTSTKLSWWKQKKNHQSKQQTKQPTVSDGSELKCMQKSQPKTYRCFWIVAFFLTCSFKIVQTECWKYCCL